MKKPKQIRALLERTLPYLRNNPERLQLFIDEGQVVATNARSLSFEYRYKLNVIITDFDRDMASVIVPLLAYLRINQNELFDNPDRRADGIRFECDYINNDTQDFSITLRLTERVKVERQAQQMAVTYLPEPQQDVNGREIAVYLRDEFKMKITEAEAEAAWAI